MAATPGKTASADRARATGAAVDRARGLRAALAGWLIPGAGHLIVGDTRRGTVFFAVLLLMVAVGLAFEGRMFPFQLAEPLVFLAAAAQWTLLGPRLVAGLGGLGDGDVRTATYEYGTTFLIVAGLLNTLILLDAYDRASGRRSA
jgi:hypothetical protein